MAIEQYLVPINRGTLCWDCLNCFGDCPWTRETGSGEIAFQPVLGWKAQKSWTWENGWNVIKCPLFVAG